MAKAGSLPLRVLALHGSNHCWREFEAVRKKKGERIGEDSL